MYLGANTLFFFFCQIDMFITIEIAQLLAAIFHLEPSRVQLPGPGKLSQKQNISCLCNFWCLKRYRNTLLRRSKAVILI